MTQYSLFCAALLVVYLVPGPDMFLLLNTGASEGRRQALMTAPVSYTHLTLPTN